ncbi:MAG: elongation factor P [Deltaproteobacteria bacterium]|nr:elongation factor P [Deltaproteobacteria bacterium]
MYSTSDFKRGLRILFKGEPYQIMEFEHHKPGKGAAIVRTRLRNLLTGITTAPTFRSGDKVEVPDLHDRDVQYLYASDDIYHFMDPQSYEQFEVPSKTLGNSALYLTEGITVSLLFYQERAINIELPKQVVLQIAECDPAVRGNTVTGASKPAKLQTGLKTQVPLFVNEGDSIKIDTKNGEYIERA